MPSRSLLPRLIVLLVAMLLLPPGSAQEINSGGDALLAELETAAGLPEYRPRVEAIEAAWDRLVEAGRIPFTSGERVTFLYRHDGAPPESVGWAGDFTKWKPRPGRRLGDSAVWVLEAELPADARCDYKIVVDGEWRLDPANPSVSWSGFGPNSQLRMPDYAESEDTKRKERVSRGALSERLLLKSASLATAIPYRVYTPAGYEEDHLEALPVVYVTDGHEYADERLGAAPVVLDNLIDAGTLSPAIVVFIDPRDPETGRNRRAEFYIGNERFAEMIAEELIPVIDSGYRTDPQPESRVLLGTSLGGLFSGWFGGRRPGVMGHLVMQSPAMGRQLIGDWEHHSPAGHRLLITGGTLGDDESPDRLAAWLEEQGISFSYEKVNDGHAWGAWRGQLAGLLVRTIGEP